MGAGARELTAGVSPKVPLRTPRKTATMSQAAMEIHTPSTTQRMRLGRVGGLWEDVAISRGLYRRGREGSSAPAPRRPVARRLACALTAAALFAPSSHAPAEEPGVRVDFPRGPLISSSRITGLAGAFTGVAEGIDGALKNPASLANRAEHATSWLDVDLALDALNAAGDTIDFDADRRTAGDRAAFTALNLGLDLSFDTLSVGLLAALVGWDGGGDASAAVDATLTDLLVAAAQAFGRGEWIVGAGLNIRALDLSEQQASGVATLALRSTTFDFGLLWRPRAHPWRLGAQLRLGGALRPKVDSGSPPSGALSAPYAVREVVAPWQLSLGFSHRSAADPARPYNAPLRAARPPRDRRYLLVSADLVLAGPSPGAVNLEGLLDGRALAAGARPSLSVHLGAEGEVLDDRLRARAGAYFEPSRVRAAGLGRLHLTGGAELHLVDLGVVDLKASVAFDVSSRFQNVLVGLGFWH